MPDINVGVVAVTAAVVGLLLYFLRKDKRAQATALIPSKYQEFELIDKKQLTHNVYRFRFALQTASTRLGLKIGNHMLLRFTDGETPVSRPYTPVTSDDEPGYFDLVVKIYDQGKMTQHLKHLAVGKTIEARGPLGKLDYQGKGKFVIGGRSQSTTRQVKSIGLIAGGTGITPMLQIVREIIKRPSDRTKMSMIFANVTEDDILLKDELDSIAAKHPEQFSVFYTLDRPSDSWTGGRGFVTADMVKEQLPAPGDDTMILMCGPPPMVNAQIRNMEAAGYSADMYFAY